MTDVPGRYANMSVKSAAAERLVKSVDWPLFHQQKLTLIQLLNEGVGQRELHLQGILHLLDAFQDMAIDEFGIAEAENTQPEEEASAGDGS